MRKERKDEHIEYCLRSEYRGDNLLDDVYFEPDSLPELDLDDVDPSTSLMGKTISMPLMINAMTGGTEMTGQINRDLAEIARDFKIPMQVGSMKIALEDKDSIESFSQIRDIMGPDGLIFANLGSDAGIDEVKKVMDMIDADGIGIHINPSQELTMSEGDRNFKGRKENLEKLSRAFPGKIIVKEVGFGFNREDLTFLNQLPLAMVDVSGMGGTNFFEIEDLRRLDEDFTEFYDWGIPTAKSLWNALKYCPDNKIMVSGGIKTASDLIRGMVMGADMGAVSGELLKFLLHGDRAYAEDYISRFLGHFKIGMLLLSCDRPEKLKKVPHAYVGRLKALIDNELRNGAENGR